MAAGGPSDKYRVCLGHIAGAHGLRGEVWLKPYTGARRDIAAYGPLQDEAGARDFEIKGLRETKQGLIARLRGVNDRESAESLKGTKLYVTRGVLTSTARDEWYFFDLIGLDVYDRAGGHVGAVVSIQNFGAGDLLEIKPQAGKATALLPFRVAFVPEVDISGGRIVIDPPKDLFED